MEPITLVDGAVLSVRPIEPDDADRLGRMFCRLSPDHDLPAVLLADPRAVAAAC